MERKIILTSNEIGEAVSDYLQKFGKFSYNERLNTVEVKSDPYGYGLRFIFTVVDNK